MTPLLYVYASYNSESLRSQIATGSGTLNVMDAIIYTVSRKKRPPKETPVTCTVYNTIKYY